MKETRNHNALVFMTTLSVCLGLVLVTSAAPISAQTSPSGGGLRVMVRQSLYGSAIEDLVRELERLREEGDALDLEKELALLDGGTPLSLATLQDFASDLRCSDGYQSLSFTAASSVCTAAAGPGRVTEDVPVPVRNSIPVTAFARASL